MLILGVEILPRLSLFPVDYMGKEGEGCGNLEELTILWSCVLPSGY